LVIGLFAYSIFLGMWVQLFRWDMDVPVTTAEAGNCV